jgi:hypothetical protein
MRILDSKNDSTLAFNGGFNGLPLALDIPNTNLMFSKFKEGMRS